MKLIGSFKLREKWWLIAATITFLSSLLYSRTAFTDKLLLQEYALIPLKGSGFAGLENVLMNCLILVIAFAIILAVWRGIYLFASRAIPVGAVIFFCVIMLFFGTYMLSLYPSAFEIEPDAHMLYAYAARRLPYYWHHILTVAFFGGCMQVIPHPIAITFFQTLFFSATMAYGIWTSAKRYGFKGGAIGVLLLLPETFYIALEPYRNCYSAVLILFLIWFVADMSDSKKMSIHKLIYFIPLCAVATVLRTEQILFVPVLLVILLFKSPSLSGRVRAISIVCFVALAFILSKVQGLGSTNYYGNDYLLVSTMNPARAILNDGENINYSGVEEDIKSLNYLCPDIAIEGVLGFRNKNEAEGRPIHQSLATQEQRKNYVRAYANLVWHNKKTFFEFQVNTALKALGTYEIYPLTYQYGNSSGRYESYMQEYETYKTELLDSAGTREWVANPIRQKLYAITNSVWTLIRRYVDVTGIPVALRFAAVIFLTIKAIISFVNCIRHKWADWAELLLSIALLGWFSIIVVMMPESRASYFYSVLFAMYAVTVEMFLKRRQA